MKNLSLLFLVLGVLALIVAGCGADLTVEEDEVDSTFTLLTINGAEYAMDGSWVEPCNNNGADSEMGTLTFSGISGNSTRLRWTGFNNCTGITPVVTSNDDFELELTGSASKGWNAAPPAGFAATVTASTFIVIQNGITGQTQMGIVDDTVNPPRAYFGDESSGTDANGYPNLLGTVPNIKQ